MPAEKAKRPSRQKIAKSLTVPSAEDGVSILRQEAWRQVFVLSLLSASDYYRLSAVCQTFRIILRKYARCSLHLTAKDLDGSTIFTGKSLLFALCDHNFTRRLAKLTITHSLLWQNIDLDFRYTYPLLAELEVPSLLSVKKGNQIRCPPTLRALTVTKCRTHLFFPASVEWLNIGKQSLRANDLPALLVTLPRSLRYLRFTCHTNVLQTGAEQKVPFSWPASDMVYLNYLLQNITRVCPFIQRVEYTDYHSPGLSKTWLA